MAVKSCLHNGSVCLQALCFWLRFNYCLLYALLNAEMLPSAFLHQFTGTFI